MRWIVFFGNNKKKNLEKGNWNEYTNPSQKMKSALRTNRFDYNLLKLASEEGLEYWKGHPALIMRLELEILDRGQML